MEEEKNIGHYTAADLKNYWAGKLSRDEMHALEKAAMEDPLLADALEGYQYATPGDDDAAVLHQKLAERTNAAPVINIGGNKYRWLKVAASIIIIAGLGLLVQQLVFKKQYSADISKTDNIQNKPEEKTNTTAPTLGDVQQSLPDTTVLENTTGGTDSKTETAIASGAFRNKSEFKTQTFAVTPDTSQKEKDNDGVADIKAQKADDQAVFKTTTPVSSAIERKDYYKEEGEISRKSIDSIRDAFAKQKTRNSDIDGRTAKSTNVLQKPGVNEGFVMQDKASWGLSFSNTYNYRVVDAQNKPVPFANVTNTRDNVGTYTDIRGMFNLVSTDSVMDVQIRSLGYNAANYRLVPSTQSGALVLKEDDEARKQILAENKKVVSSVVRKDSSELEEPEVGWNNYNTYVANNIQIPETLRAKNARSDVELSFDIDRNGNPVNIKVTKSSQCKACDDEAIRLLKEGPKWKRKGKKNKTTISIAVDQR